MIKRSLPSTAIRGLTRLTKHFYTRLRFGEKHRADTVFLAAGRDEDRFDKAAQLAAIAIHLDHRAALRLRLEPHRAGTPKIRCVSRAQHDVIGRGPRPAAHAVTHRAKPALARGTAECSGHPASGWPRSPAVACPCASAARRSARR